jgi:murein DD-endopeptidase MepM/ murein hydrolase activator NlpD
MAGAAELLGARIYPRAIILMLLGLSAAGCSADPNGGNDPYPARSEVTGSIRPDQGRSSPTRSSQVWADRQAVAEILRPPMPVPMPDEPVNRSAAVAPVHGTGINQREDLARAAPVMPRARPQGAASGQKPILLASRPVGRLPEATRAKSVAPPAHVHEPATIAIPEPKPKAPPASEVAVLRQPPGRPETTPAPVPAPAPAPVPAPSPDASAPIGSLKAAEAGSNFYWPVHGQLIAGYGAKINGLQNNGINVAVPEDTPVKAADDGVVIYSGNGLKTYGNLLLVRHANGYVTVYAHAKELLVKVGDEIKRGQVIAKSGRTGDVDRPQVHFEIRKASAPVNPMPYLNGA